AFHRRTVYDLQRAVAHFDTAIAREPGYARAHASLAEVYALLGAYDYGALPPQTAFATARAAAKRALAIDPNLAEAHNAMASVLFNYDWDWSGAEREFVRAIQLSPSYAAAHHWYALLLQCAGREREAFQAITRARELDPLSPVIGTALARHYYLARRSNEAIAGYRRIAENDSTFVTARVGLGLSLAAHGEYQAAIEQYQTAQRLLPVRTPLIDGLLANAYGRLGARDKALAHVASIQAVAGQRYVPAEYLAVAFIGLGDNDRAFQALEQAFANRSAGLAYLEIEPLVDPLRTDPRFPALIEKIRAARK
ncbi:MAG TPA: tetratricopeptide repeat protein, partial [Longimicrobiales bacterium]